MCARGSDRGWDRSILGRLLADLKRFVLGVRYKGYQQGRQVAGPKPMSENVYEYEI